MRNRAPYFPLELLDVRVQEAAAEARVPLELRFDGWKWFVRSGQQDISDPLNAPDIRLWTAGFKAAIRLMEGDRIGGGAK
jgi:hypothetical protein